MDATIDAGVSEMLIYSEESTSIPSLPTQSVPSHKFSTDNMMLTIPKIKPVMPRAKVIRVKAIHPLFDLTRSRGPRKISTIKAITNRRSVTIAIVSERVAGILIPTAWGRTCRW